MTPTIEERLFVELPQDELGNRMHEGAVVQGTIVTESGMSRLHITAPEGYVYENVHADNYAEVSAEAGPPRILDDWTEMDLILDKYRV